MARHIGKKVITVNCAIDLEQQAASLLDTLAELDAKGPPLHEGSVIDFGWSRLTLLADDGQLVVCEPDYSGDPIHQTVQVIDATVRVSLAQADLLSQLGVQGVDARWDSLVAVQQDALNNDRVYLERLSSSNPEYSGWYVGEVEKNKHVKSQDLQRLYVYELYRRRPKLLEVLALPPGWLIVFQREAIEGIFDPFGKNRLGEGDERHLPGKR